MGKGCYSVKTEQEIRSLAEDYVAGKVFTDLDCPQEIVPRVFVGLASLSSHELAQMEACKIALVYQYLEHAGRHPVRYVGEVYPTFSSHHMLDVYDMNLFTHEVNRLRPKTQSL